MKKENGLKKTAGAFSVSAIILALAMVLSSGTPDPVKEPKNEIELGERLFFETILSKDSTISCASCHKPEFAFADTLAISPGVHGALGRRNAPSVMNMEARSIFFYDGRAETLIDQVHFPIEDPLEMNISVQDVVKRLNNHPRYYTWFKKIYNEEVTQKNLASAIAAFESSLETSDTPFDDYMNGDKSAMSASAIRGREVFMSPQAKCFDCHFGPDFTGDEFKNIGLYDEQKWSDKGRYEISKNPVDLGKFKVPGLRNVAMTAPYMHDGSFKTLKEVIDYYDNPYKFVHQPLNIDTLLAKPLNLTESEKSDLESFLLALTDRRFNKKD
ncbi:MAG: cytochrome-c peroxidase [Saprospiraceae bacterium]|nr:cytochrome-c peroxidase [Saprospiraceae bacterium]